MTSPLPVHPWTGVPAVGVVAGRPVWPILGAALDDDQDQDQDQDQDSGGSGGGTAGAVDTAGDAAPPDWAAEAAKWKAQSRKHEDRAKRNAGAAKELDDLKRSQMSDEQKVTEAARAEGRAEASRHYTSRLVAAEVRAAAAGRLTDPARDALLAGLDETRFLTDKGEVDTGKVSAMIDGIAPEGGAAGRPFLDWGGGRRPGVPVTGVDAGRDMFHASRKRHTNT